MHDLIDHDDIEVVPEAKTDCIPEEWSQECLGFQLVSVYEDKVLVQIVPVSIV